MVELNHRERTIKVKIVYYGPPVGGKTTNLQVLHQHAQATRRGELISVNSAQDRTILFDLLPLKAAGFRGFDLRFQVLAVPGQAMYAATRRLVLKGADSLVFVANSAADRWEENIQSFREMTQNLLAHQLDPTSLPLVLQYNKRDLPEVTPVEFMDRTLNARKSDSIPAVAVRGEGVLETFGAILMRTMKDLSSRYQIVEVPKGQTVQQWTQQTIQGLFGTASLAVEPHPLPADVIRSAMPRPAGAATPSEPWRTPERRTVRVTLPEETVRMAWTGPDARANETLVESYAQASTQLSSALAEIRDERDTALRRLEDIQHAQNAAHDVMAGQPLEATLRTVLGRMADAAGATHATFLVPGEDRSLRAVALRAIPEDPLLKVPAGVQHVTERFLTETEPHLHQSADSLDLGDALESGTPPFAAVVSVPVRTPRGLQGIAMLYYTPDAALPRPEVVGHIGAVGRALAAALELAAVLAVVRSAEKALPQAVAASLAARGIEDVVASLVSLRDRLGALRQNPKAPSWFLEEFSHLAPSLSEALSITRSLLAFGRGQIQKDSVDAEEVVADLRSSGLTVQLSGEVRLAGDAALLRQALGALVDHLRDGDPARARALQVRVEAEGGRVKIRVGIAGPGGELPEAYADLRSPGTSLRRTDLRLAVAQKVVELHGGTLSPESDPAAGHWAAITLPAG